MMTEYTRIFVTVYLEMIIRTLATQLTATVVTSTLLGDLDKNLKEYTTVLGVESHGTG
jgi:hypothetical protein